MRVGLVEDDALLRTTLAESLGARDELEVVSQSASPTEIVQITQADGVDVAVLDVHLGTGPSGIDVAKILRRSKPLVGIVFLSSVKDPRLLGIEPEQLPQGSLYFLKSSVSDIDELADAVRRVADDPLGGSSVSKPRVDLTRSQIEILRLVAQGFSNAEIAEQKVVTQRAVEMALSRLAKQLNLREVPGANQRVHIVMRFFREMGWTP